MTLKASPHAFIVTPTGDDTETERGDLIIVSKPAEGRRQPVIYRGVIEHVGSHIVADELAIGQTIFYTDFMELEGKHVVTAQQFLAYDDGE